MDVPQHLSTLWTVLLWGLGLCATGFFLLAGWIWILVGRVKTREDLIARMDKMNVTLDSIETALKGNYDKRGLITKIFDLEETQEKMAAICAKNHGT